MAISTNDQRLLDFLRVPLDILDGGFASGYHVDPLLYPTRVFENRYIGGVAGWAMVACDFPMDLAAHLRYSRQLALLAEAMGGPTVAATGTFLTTPTEGEVVTGGQTIILTLTGETWIAAGAALTEAIRRSLTVRDNQAAGWNVKIRAVLTATEIVRTSGTVVTVTLPAAAAYAIATDEVLDIVVVRAALTAAANPIAVPSVYTIVAA